MQVTTQHEQRNRPVTNVIKQTFILLALLLTLQPAHSQLPSDPLRLQMENPRNPLLLVQTSAGDLYLELFPQAAPLNVQRVLDLIAPGDIYYYDNLTFHRTINSTLIQVGAPERANRSRPIDTVPDEINARGLGLEQQRLLDERGRPHAWLNVRDLADFQTRVLAPLYRSMRITDADQLQARQETVLQRLKEMNLMQAYENMGYRYNSSLPSRRPQAGSVLMANYGPDTNDGELLITLTDTPWLTGTHTVIGRVMSGLTLAGQISREPEASVRVFRIRMVDFQSDTSAADV
tara:strand:+ start:43391 stop:44263 length:873 start_codon:yes stop_codon:yes gene_type:complete